MRKPKSKKQTRQVEESASAVGFLTALDQASKEKYLGNPEVIGELLLDYSHDAVLRRTSDLPDEEASICDQGHAMALAEVFLGRVSAFAPMIPWNSPGNIDQWLAKELKHLDVAGETAEQTVTNAMLIYLNESYRLTAFGADGCSEEEWNAMFAGNIQRFTNLLLGIPTPLKSEEQPNQPGERLCG